MYREHLIETLTNATALVLECLNGDRSIRDFVNEYANFYYSEALDGHEANDEQKLVLDELDTAIEFHEKVQTQVVNAISFAQGEDLDRYLASGRISMDEAMIRLKELAGRYDAGKLLNMLNE